MLKVLCLFFFLIINMGMLFGDSVFVKELEVNLIQSNQVKIGWEVNTNHGVFRIFRKPDWMISRVSNIEQADLVFQGEMSGIQEKNLFQYSFFDSISNIGNYYYLVLAGTNKPSEDDLRPDYNYSLLPIVITNAIVIIKNDNQKIISNSFSNLTNFGLATNVIKPEKNRDLIVSNISWKINMLSIFLFWDFQNPDGRDHTFSIFKTTNKILSEKELKALTPYLKVKGEQFVEDPDAWVGLPNYYTVIVDENFLPLNGVNQLSEPIWIGNTNENIPVIRETFILTNISRKEFEAQFTNKK